MKKAIQLTYDNMFENSVKNAKDAGFKYISTDFSKSRILNVTEWEGTIDNINNILNKYNVKCIQTHSPYYDLKISSEIIDEAREKHILKSIEASSRIGAKWWVYHPRTSITSNYDKDASLKDNIKSIGTYIGTAKKFKIGIAVENIPEFPLLPHMSFYTSDYRDLKKLIDSFNDKIVQCCWDFGHANLMHKKWNQKDAIYDMGSRIKCTHIHNNRQIEDDHLSPDLGTIDWNNVLKALRDIKYDGPLTSEIHWYVQDNDIERSYLTHNYNTIKYIEKLLNKESRK